MTQLDSDLAIKSEAVRADCEKLEHETDKLSDINDEPGLKQEQVEGFLASLIRIFVAVLKS